VWQETFYSLPAGTSWREDLSQSRWAWSMLVASVLGLPVLGQCCPLADQRHPLKPVLAAAPAPRALQKRRAFPDAVWSSTSYHATPSTCHARSLESLLFPTTCKHFSLTALTLWKSVDNRLAVQHHTYGCSHIHSSVACGICTSHAYLNDGKGARGGPHAINKVNATTTKSESKSTTAPYSNPSRSTGRSWVATQRGRTTHGWGNLRQGCDEPPIELHRTEIIYSTRVT